MKQLISLIDTKGKSTQQIYEEAQAAIQQHQQKQSPKSVPQPKRQKSNQRDQE